MLPLACVCVPVLGVLIAGLLADRSYLAGLRRIRQMPSLLPQPVVVARPVASVSARPAA